MHTWLDYRKCILLSRKYFIMWLYLWNSLAIKYQNFYFLEIEWNKSIKEFQNAYLNLLVIIILRNEFRQSHFEKNSKFRPQEIKICHIREKVVCFRVKLVSYLIFVKKRIKFIQRIGLFYTIYIYILFWGLLLIRT